MVTCVPPPIQNGINDVGRHRCYVFLLFAREIVDGVGVKINQLVHAQAHLTGHRFSKLKRNVSRTTGGIGMYRNRTMCSPLIPSLPQHRPPRTLYAINFNYPRLMRDNTIDGAARRTSNLWSSSRRNGAPPDPARASDACVATTSMGARGSPRSVSEELRAQVRLTAGCARFI